MRTTNRINVALIEKADADLTALCASTGLTVTDVVNRALQCYRLVNDTIASGEDILIRTPDGEVQKIVILA